MILYEPAVEHKRPNKEVRFTLRNRSIMENLSKDDVLCFTKEAGPSSLSGIRQDGDRTEWRRTSATPLSEQARETVGKRR